MRCETVDILDKSIDLFDLILEIISLMSVAQLEYIIAEGSPNSKAFLMSLQRARDSATRGSWRS